MRSQASARCPSGRRPATDRSHWLVLPGCQVLRPVAAWSARVPGRGWRCLPRANRAHTTFPVWLGVVQPHWSLSARMRCSPRPVSSREPSVRGAGAVLPGSSACAQDAGPGLEQAEPDRLPWPGIAGPGQGMPQRVGHELRHYDRDVRAAFCHAPLVPGGDGKVPGGADRSGIRAERACGDPRQPGPEREAGSGHGRHLPLARPAVSAAGISQRCPPGMTGALPSLPGRCHRASRIGVCRFCDHQVLAGLTGLTRCRLAAAASSPGSDRIEDRTAGMGGTGRVSGVSASGHGLIGRGIVVPFQLRPAGRGVAAGSAAGVTAAARRGWDPGGPGDGRVPVPRHDRAGGPVAGVVLLALGAG